ncbi:hypothetical protein BH23ACT5_BH23ACT5_12580 [soil metagenome]
MGLDHRKRGTRLASGWADRIGERALILGGVPLTDRARAMAAVLDVRGRSYLSHTSAAWLWGIPGFDLDPIHVARRFEGTRRSSSIARIHNLRGVPDSHLGDLDGIPVASPVLACFQVAAVTASRGRTERAVDNVLAMGLARPGSFHGLLQILAQRGRNGIRIMRSIAAERPADYRPPESGNESRFQWICDEWGFPVRRQVSIGTDDHFVTRVDFQDDTYPHLVYRIQSARWHGALSHARDDHQEAAQLAGRFTVIDIWDRDLWRQPHKVAITIAAARRQAALA